MSTAKVISSRKISEKEMELVNSKILKIGPQLRLFGGSITKYDNGKCIATFATEAYDVNQPNASSIGELMLSLMDYIDEVQHNGVTVAVR